MLPWIFSLCSAMSEHQKIANAFTITCSACQPRCHGCSKGKWEMATDMSWCVYSCHVAGCALCRNGQSPHKSIVLLQCSGWTQWAETQGIRSNVTFFPIASFAKELGQKKQMKMFCTIQKCTHYHSFPFFQSTMTHLWIKGDLLRAWSVWEKAFFLTATTLFFLWIHNHLHSGPKMLES